MKTAHTSSGSRVLLWLRIIRPQTLSASLCPVLTGLMVAYRQTGCGSMRCVATGVLTLVCALALQILSNLINDYYDFVRGTDKRGRVGFSRALAEGEVSVAGMRTACFAALGAAVLTGLYLCYAGGWQVLCIGLTALLFAWLYTATDYSLSYLGIADIFVFLYYGVIATMGTAWLQYRAAGVGFDFGALSCTAFYAGAVCGLISMCVLAVNNIRDIDDDRVAGKRTFPVRFGKKAALAVFGVIVVLMPVFAWLAFGASPAVAVVLPALYLYVRVLRAQGAEYNRCLVMAGIVNMIYVLLVMFSV